ncbi:fatty acid desaturase 4, chloroplastic [Macadamia integrifolia]|uniref:fatty acid desaturase 4, chloroplastic n=1 Tax=Macadamia integrifolia TaxID=60698 RepID=UPI001C52E9F6|nr:fatty acid desaturase 4, chloroplastic [Macadamia integrifolia]
MSILPHHKYPLRCSSHHHAQLAHPPLTTHVRCAATTTTTKPVGTLRPSSAVPTATDPDLQSTWTHRTWVATGCTSVLVSLAKSAMAASETSPTMWLEPLLASYLGYLLADLGSGVYHWAIDNYGDASTLVVGSQIEAFQGHHKWPWTITRRQFANNLHALARAVAFVVVPIDLTSNDMVVNAFVGVCSGCIMFSQQFHAWAHGTKSRLPPLVVALQDAGVLVSRTQHATHHRPPYNNNYCIVSGAWNEFLDRQRVFEALEMVLFFKFGVRPRSWSEPNPEWTEESEITSLQTKPHLREPQDLVCT